MRFGIKMLRTCQTFECLVHVVQLVEYSLTLDANLFQVGKKYKLLRFGCHLSKTFTFEIPSTTIRILKYTRKSTFIWYFFLGSRVTYRWQSLYPLDGCETNHLHWARSFFSNLSLGYNLIEWFLLLLFICRRKKKLELRNCYFRY